MQIQECNIHLDQAEEMISKLKDRAMGFIQSKKGKKRMKIVLGTNRHHQKDQDIHSKGPRRKRKEDRKLIQRNG